MADRNQVIYDIERCVCKVPDACSDCSKHRTVVPLECLEFECMEELMKDALELLKEQEPKAISYKENWMTGLPVAICPRCGRFARQFHMEHSGEETHFCPWCGQAVKWE